MSSTLALLFFLALTSSWADATLVTDDHDDNYSYTLHFELTGYSWGSANQQCRSLGATLATVPLNSFVEEMITFEHIVDDVWITDISHTCRALQSVCARWISSSFGGGHCMKTELKPIPTDCGARKNYVICIGDYTTTPVPTTTTTTTTTTTPTTTTTTTTTTTPAPTTTTVKSSPTEDPKREEDGEKRVRGEQKAENDGKRRTSAEIGEKETDKHGGGVAGFVLGLSVAKTDLLGLIIGVVVGTFLILSLVFVLCCACQGRNAKAQKNYALVEKNSNNSMNGDLKNPSNASTNTLETPCSRTVSTEESSIEMSDTRSQSTKQSDDVCVSVYPPPPRMYDTPNVYSVIPTVNQHQTKLNPLYVHHQAVAQELPLPPPPPHIALNIAEDPVGEEEACIKGLNPTFKTFLDRTIAVKPMNIHGNRTPAHSPPMKERHPETRGLITSDL